VVELDGHATHANAPANETDRHRELVLRQAGFHVVRYTWQQITRRPDEVVADLIRLLGA
jgi:very-short-patch-repair endonuclease